MRILIAIALLISSASVFAASSCRDVFAQSAYPGARIIQDGPRDATFELRDTAAQVLRLLQDLEPAPADFNLMIRGESITLQRPGQPALEIPRRSFETRIDMDGVSWSYRTDVAINGQNYHLMISENILGPQSAHLALRGTNGEIQTAGSLSATFSPTARDAGRAFEQFTRRSIISGILDQIHELDVSKVRRVVVFEDIPPAESVQRPAESNGENHNLRLIVIFEMKEEHRYFYFRTGINLRRPETGFIAPPQRMDVYSRSQNLTTVLRGIAEDFGVSLTPTDALAVRQY